MATITKRKTGWAVQVRRKGYTPRCKTFRAKGDAQTWAREQEAEIDRGGLPVCDRSLKSETLMSLLDRYLLEVTPRKQSRETETQRLRKLQRHSICQLPLRELRPAHLSAYEETRARISGITSAIGGLVFPAYLVAGSLAVIAYSVVTR